MPRLRMLLGSTVAALAVMILAAAIQAQDPAAQNPQGGGGRGGRGGGPPGGFGGGPGMFFGGPGGFGRGGPGGGLLQLAMNPAVQEDLKLTEKQKEALKTADDAISKKRQEMFKGFGGNRGNRGATKNGGGGAANGNNGQDPNANGNAIVQFPGNGGNGQDPNAPPPDFAAMREAMMANMEALQKQTDIALRKILNKTQMARLGEIDLQRQGPLAVLREDIATKLGISEEQMAAMQEIMNESRTQQREAGQAQRQIMASVRQQMTDSGLLPNPGGGGGGNGNPADPNAAAGGNNGGGGGRNRRGGGGPGGGPGGGQAFRDAMDKFMASNPEVKAQMDQAKKAGDQLQKQTINAIGQVLSKGQKAKFKKMQGKEFDLSKLTGGPGGPPPTAAATDGAEKKADTTAETGSSKKSTTKKSTTKKSTTKKTMSKKPAA